MKRFLVVALVVLAAVVTSYTMAAAARGATYDASPVAPATQPPAEPAAQPSAASPGMPASTTTDQSASLPPSTAPSIVRPLTPCGFGFVVWMVYGKLDTTPSGGTCWTLQRPVTADTASYTTCDVSNINNGKTVGSGTTFVYDDTNNGGHSYSAGSFGSPLSDAQADSDYCGGRTSWWGEWMSPSGGYHWAWTPTLLFEEDYDGFHNPLTYTTSVATEGIGGSGSSYSPVPSVDADEPNVASKITSMCFDTVGPNGYFYFGIYNNVEISTATVNAIVNALTSCFN